MNEGRMLVGGLVVGICLGAGAGIAAYALAPPIQFPGQWSWLNAYGRLGVAVVVGWFAFVLALVLTIFGMVAQGFAEMEGARR